MDETQNNWGIEESGRAVEEIVVVDPSPAEKKPRKSLPARISDHKLDEALKELDLLSISSEKLRGFSAIGRFLDQIGIVQYGNGRLVGTAEAMSSAIKTCADVVSDDKADNDTKERFMLLQIRLARALDSNIALMNKISDQGSVKKPQAEQQNKPFAVGGIVSPIQINVHAAPLATPEKAI